MEGFIMGDHKKPPAIALFDWDVPIRQLTLPGIHYYSFSFPGMICDLSSPTHNETQDYFERCLKLLAIHWGEKGHLTRIYVFVRCTENLGQLIPTNTLEFLINSIKGIMRYSVDIKPMYYLLDKEKVIFFPRTKREIKIPRLSPNKVIINCCDPRMNVILRESNDLIISAPGAIYMTIKYFFNRSMIARISKAIKVSESKELIIIYHTPDCAAHAGLHGCDIHAMDPARTIEQAERKLRTAVKIFQERLRIPGLRIVGQRMNIETKKTGLPSIITWHELDENGNFQPLDNLNREIIL